MLFERGAIDRVNRSEAMFEGCSGAQAAQFCLDHCPQVAGRMMTELNYAARLALEHYHHASSDLGCWNCHYLLNLSDFSTLVWPLIAADGLLQTTSLAARWCECPAADSGFCP
jgi:hypothetical protein